MRRTISLVVFILSVLIISGCVKEDTYTVYKDDIPVLEVKDKPGYLVSTGYFPDEELVKHSFLDARALTPDYEDELGEIIRDSEDFDHFLDLLYKHKEYVRFAFVAYLNLARVTRSGGINGIKSVIETLEQAIIDTKLRKQIINETEKIFTLMPNPNIKTAI